MTSMREMRGHQAAPGGSSWASCQTMNTAAEAHHVMPASEAACYSCLSLGRWQRTAASLCNATVPSLVLVSVCQE